MVSTASFICSLLLTRCTLIAPLSMKNTERSGVPCSISTSPTRVSMGCR
jgi:hypothetical protein